MLTDGLEKAIQRGMAVFKTFAVGGSGVGTIPVPKNHFIIIIDFDFFYFADLNQVFEDGFERSIHQLEFRSKLSQNHFIIRNENMIFEGAGLPIPNGVYQKDTYLVHQDNVQIDIVAVPNAKNWVGVPVYSQLPLLSQETATPVGYGMTPGGEPATRKIQFSATEEYLPLTKLRDDIAVANYREQFRVDVNTANKLNPVGGEAVKDYSYPILNVSYVEFSVPWNQFVKGSN